MSKIYPVSISELRHLNRIRGNTPLQRLGAIKTGEKRPPLQGEWYLSGAIVEAYYAPNDLITPFLIAKIVETQQSTEVVKTIT